MYILNMVIILIIMYCNVVTAIDKIPTYLLCFNSRDKRFLLEEVLDARYTVESIPFSIDVVTRFLNN